MKLFKRKNIFLLCLLLSGYTIHAQKSEQVQTNDSAKAENAVVCFAGCEKAENVYFSITCSKRKIVQYIAAKLELPETVEEGEVRVQLDFNNDGTLAGSKILKALNEESGQSVLTAAQTLPNLMPAMKEQEAMVFSYNVSIKITSDSNYYETLQKTPVLLDPHQGGKALESLIEMPRFPGCESEPDVKSRRTCSDKKMLEFVSANVVYPEKARKNGVEGAVVIRFMVDVDGEIIYPQVVKEIGVGCGAEAVRVVKNMPMWHSGISADGKIPVFFNLPVRFRLDKKKRKRRKRRF